jgi:hypothetical protein
MKVALLSAGPSLRKSFDPAVPYKLRIGVNTAVQFHKCDWWVCADSHRVEEIESKVIGKPKLFMVDGQRDQMDGDCRKRWKITGWREVTAEIGASMSWLNNSGPAALLLAKWLGATHVDCYGVDMAGGLDATMEQTPSSKYRNDQRWALEKSFWHLISQWVSERGMTVNRIGVEHGV